MLSFAYNSILIKLNFKIWAFCCIICKLETNAHFPHLLHIFLSLSIRILVLIMILLPHHLQEYMAEKWAPRLFLIIYEFWFDNCCVFHITKLGFWNEDILIWFNWVWLFRLKWGVFSLIIFEIMVMVWDWVLFCFCILCFVFIRLRLSSILA